MQNGMQGMEYIVVLAMIVLGVIVFFARGMLAQRKEQARLMERLKRNYGLPPQKDWKPECYENLDCYHLYHRMGVESGKRHEIDDITWNDLEMDRIFMRIDYTMSRAGAEYLYHTLRSPQLKEERLLQMEGQIVWFMEHEKERVRLQLLLKKLGRMEKYSLYQYLEQLDAMGKRSNLKHMAGNLFYLISALLFTVNTSYGLVAMMLTAAVNIGSYLKEKSEINPYLTSLAYILSLLKVSEKVKELDWPVLGQEREELLSACAKLKKFSRGSGMVIGGGASGNPGELVLDYISMLFHIDLILFNKMYREVMRYRKEIDRMFGIWGYLDTVISIGAFRASLPSWCVPEFKEEAGWQMEDGYHPLLEHPVMNSIRAGKGVLITGSNASGKSTFLKTAALNALLAQTIHTGAAQRLVMRMVRLYSSMALRDDMESGESYYMVEIRSMKRILEAVKAAEGEQLPVLCFVDEVLRGTNTVERIAASTQVLKGLSGEAVQCFAATHDTELCELLEREYDNYHFEEEIKNGDVLFSYLLKSGGARTRNAIRLLEVMGYDTILVDRAEKQAQHFLETGQWKPDAEAQE